MRRWTILLISHDTEASKSFSFTERTLRRAASVGAALLLVALIGVGSFVARLGNLPRGTGMTAVSKASVSPEVAALQAQLGALRGALDTIRHEDARLRAVAGVPTTDSETLTQRFTSKLPRFLRAKTSKPDSMLSPLPAAQLAAASASADTLLTHAAGLTAGYRKLGPASPGLDSLEILSLRPESLQVATRAVNARVRRDGRTVHWVPGRRGALLAGFDAEVSTAVEQGSGWWQIDLRAPGGLVGRVRAMGIPAVRPGEKVLADQAVMLVAPSASMGSASYELRRNGVSLDPTFPRVSLARSSGLP